MSRSAAWSYDALGQFYRTNHKHDRAYAVPYKPRPDRIANPGPLLGSLRACRETVTRAMADVKPFGTIYYGLGMVVAAIDALALLLTRQPHYFSLPGSTMPQGQAKSEAEKMEQERSATHDLQPRSFAENRDE